MKAWKHALILSCFLWCAACSNQDQRETIDLGVVVGPEADIADIAQKMANNGSYDFRLQPHRFADYTSATLALCEGKVDAAIEPMSYLQQQLADPAIREAMKAANCELSVLTHTYVYTMALYSRTLSSLNQLPQQGVVAVPSAPLSTARALMLLQSAGLIKLRPGVSSYATVNDIVSNPHQLIIVPINPNQLSESIAEASLIVVSSLYSLETGAYVKDALFTESSPKNAMLIVVRKSDLHDIEFASLVALYHSPAMIQAVEQMTANGAVPAWDN